MDPGDGLCPGRCQSTDLMVAEVGCEGGEDIHEPAPRVIVTVDALECGRESAKEDPDRADGAGGVENGAGYLA